MIISELIKGLQEYDGTLEVIIGDCEGGYTRVQPPMFYVSGIVERDAEEKQWVYGEYVEKKGGIPALFIDYSERE